jgi:glucoamylase
MAASEIRDGASKYLWREDLGRFCRMLHRDKKGALEVDGTCDSSIWGLFSFGMYTPDDLRITKTMTVLTEKLWLNTKVGGMARYENDGYYHISDDVPGNPWIISTLWLADHIIRTATDEEKINKAMEILMWTANHALPSGILAEQLHPHTGEPLSVSPLTWSHASFVTIVQRYKRWKAAAKTGTPSERTKDWMGKLFAQTCSEIHGTCRIE